MIRSALRRAACLCLGSVFAATALAQQPARPAPDSTRPADSARAVRDTARAAADTGYAVVFSEDIMSNAPQYVTLSSHTAYRVDVIFEGDVRLPIGALTIELRGGGAAPLVLRSMENPSVVEGGQSFLVTPTVTGEYRMVLHYTGTPTHIRIVRDPRELALLQGRAKPSLATLTASVRGVYVTGAQTISGANVYNKGGMLAWELCLGLERGRFPSMPKLGGCLMTFGRYFQSGNGAVLQMVGTNPDYLLTHKFGAEISASPLIAFGRASQNSNAEVSYWIVGAGVDAGWKLFGVPALEFSVSPGITVVHQGGYNIPGPPAHDSPSHDVLGLRFAAGLHVHL